MAKESGLGMTFSVDDAGGVLRDISNDTTNVSFSTTRGEQNTTGLDKSGMEKLLLVADGQVTANGVFNDAANKSFDVLKTAGTYTGNRTVTIAISGQTLSMEMVLTNVQWSRPQGGEMTWAATFNLADGTVPTWS